MSESYLWEKVLRRLEDYDMEPVDHEPSWGRPPETGRIKIDSQWYIIRLKHSDAIAR